MIRVQFRLLLSLALSIPCFSALAQSFDCAKATTTVERLVCADRRLGALDGELGAEVKRSLAADPAHRAEKLGEARKWLGERDRLCALPAGELRGEARAKALACLTAAYEARLAALKAAPAAPETSAICRKLADRYAALLAKDPEAPYKKSFYAESPLQVLAAAPDAGVVVAAPAANIDDVTRAKLAAWAKGEPQPFVFPDALATKLVDLGVGASLFIDRLPGENLYAAGVIRGTLGYYSAIYFTVSAGFAHETMGPGGLEGESEAECIGAFHSFGTLDGEAVAFQESHDNAPRLSSSISITPWRSGGFGPACTAHFEFAPKFAEHATYNQWEEHCAGADCEALRKEALSLVEAAQKQPLAARKAALARLSATQAAEFAKMEEAAGPDFSGEPDDPAQYGDENGKALRLPFLHGGRLYLAELGHFTIGWRVFSDWRVALEQLDKGKLAETSVFAIGMTKGALRSASAK
ncbi:lysozyme inhibitor LprI family protein [Methylosinus sp. LW4]|uniref:lysozyme inhibitor LprI family protein n=1 Tax=Methylosinus sp. LW4 TaxID=136993 RepID=UPI000360E1DB|nr:hypothetical protein [Methylosinus sp. LW4]